MGTRMGMAKQPMGRGSYWGRNQGEERMAMILRGAGCQPTALCADRGAHSDNQVGSVLRVKGEVDDGFSPWRQCFVCDDVFGGHINYSLTHGLMEASNGEQARIGGVLVPLGLLRPNFSLHAFHTFGSTLMVSG